MKNILLVCNRSNIDKALRRSMAHLTTCCQIEIVANGYQAYYELSNRAFELIIIDAEIEGIDSLELVESIGYIDPGIPVILMLKEKHRALWGEARVLRADPILRPFKPLIFLRLVDTLLHQHLERYRDLSEILTATLQSLTAQPGTVCAFLADGDGQVLLDTNTVDRELLASLAQLAARPPDTAVSKKQYAAGHPLVAAPPAKHDHTLFVASVIENLRLAMLVGSNGRLDEPENVHPLLNAATERIRQAILKNAYLENSTTENDASGTELSEIGSPVDSVILLKLSANTIELPAEPDTIEDDEVAINWQILSNSADTLSRLETILSS